MEDLIKMFVNFKYKDLGNNELQGLFGKYEFRRYSTPCSRCGSPDYGMIFTYHTGSCFGGYCKSCGRRVPLSHMLFEIQELPTAAKPIYDLK